MKTVGNAIRLLREFSPDKPVRGVSELARSLRLDRSTVHRLLRTLLAESLIEQVESTRRYRLGPGVVDLARNFLVQNGIAGMTMPCLRRLRQSSGESVGVQILDKNEVVWVAAEESAHPLRVSCYAGERVPVHCTSPGLLFLAFQSRAARATLLSGKLKKYTANTVIDRSKIAMLVARVREQGVAATDSTYEPDVRAVSAPIWGASETDVAAVTIVASRRRVSLDDLDQMARLVKDTAAAVTQDIRRFGSIRV
jgi:DNA-binding IclR family transcriptional regulator